jgi:hypothetical protein
MSFRQNGSGKNDGKLISVNRKDAVALERASILSRLKGIKSWTRLGTQRNLKDISTGAVDILVITIDQKNG